VVTFLMELPRHDGRGGSVASLLVHSLLIGASVLATMQTGVLSSDPHRAVPIEIFRPSRQAEPPPARLLLGLRGPRFHPEVLSISPAIPRMIPPPSPAPFDPSSFVGFEPAPVTVTPDTARRRVEVYAERGLDQPPALLSRPALVYPPILREAGISGRVIIEAVIDTAGRAERESIRLVSASHALLAQPAIDLVAGALFRPGRLEGRAVRVRVRLPIDFRVDARGGAGRPQVQ